MNVLKKIRIYLLAAFFICCTKENNNKADSSHYLIILPQDWKKINVPGIDSDVQIVITKNGDSIYFDFGKFSEKFDETNKVFSIAQIKKYKAMGMDTDNLFFSNTPEIDQAQGTFLKEYYYYVTIDKVRGKIKVPKIIGKGEVGIYFDSIDNKNNRLSIIGKNLNENDQKDILKSFNTIKFKR
ncbi:hypothetical protein [Flavobacterium aquidurense]|uniref:hypothetical protein n=1 Tax=Flavobacterium aquidurense TaxID=362413 RepID=UPI0037185C84